MPTHIDHGFFYLVIPDVIRWVSKWWYSWTAVLIRDGNKEPSQMERVTFWTFNFRRCLHSVPCLVSSWGSSINSGKHPGSQYQWCLSTTFGIPQRNCRSSIFLKHPLDEKNKFNHTNPSNPVYKLAKIHAGIMIGATTQYIRAKTNTMLIFVTSKRRRWSLRLRYFIQAPKWDPNKTTLSTFRVAPPPFPFGQFLSPKNLSLQLKSHPYPSPTSIYMAWNLLLLIHPRKKKTPSLVLGPQKKSRPPGTSEAK